MFRSEENARAGSVRSGTEIDQDDGGSAFSGATLKISGAESLEPSLDTQQGIEGATSSVLSGSDGAMGGTRTNNEAAGNETATPEQPSQVVIVKPKVGSPKNFFSFREGLLEQAVSDCVNIILRPANDTDIVGTWLLTEISHWDHERERIFILTTKTLLEVKYDFISLRIIENTKLRLNQIDTIRRGNITYSENSLIPKIGGITNGVTTLIVDGFNACKDYQRFSNQGLTVANRFDFSSFKPIERSETGIRIMWNKGQPIGWMSSWNPFASNIPWKTVTDHPLYTYQDPYNSPHIQEGLEKYRKYYSVDGLYEALHQTINNNNSRNMNDNLPVCRFEEDPIVIQNYIGVAAMIHNKHNFGFFKDKYLNRIILRLKFNRRILDIIHISYGCKEFIIEFRDLVVNLKSQIKSNLRNLSGTEELIKLCT